MKLSALVDNIRLQSRMDLRVERGLSLHIRSMGKQLLFDAGSSKAFCDNAALLNINISDVDAAVISHRHHDHGNGLRHFLTQNAHAPVYLRACEEADYSFKAFGLKRNVGIDGKLFIPAAARLICVDDTVEILPNMFIVTNLSTKYAQPKGNKYLFTDTGDGDKPDTFAHELLLIVKESDGLIVFTGCAHHGVLNMIDTATTLFPDCRIKAVVGGYHLVGLPLFNSIGGSRQDIEAIAETILTYPVDKLYTGHCTGIRAFDILQGVLGERLEYLPTGRRVII